MTLLAGAYLKTSPVKRDGLWQAETEPATAQTARSRCSYEAGFFETMPSTPSGSMIF